MQNASCGVSCATSACRRERNNDPLFATKGSHVHRARWLLEANSAHQSMVADYSSQGHIGLASCSWSRRGRFPLSVLDSTNRRAIQLAHAQMFSNIRSVITPPQRVIFDKNQSARRAYIEQRKTELAMRRQQRWARLSVIRERCALESLSPVSPNLTLDGREVRHGRLVTQSLT